MTQTDLDVHDPKRNPIVQVISGEVRATSRDVAAFFGKRHDHVMRDIDRLIEQEPSLGSDHIPTFGEMVSEVDIGSGAKRRARTYTMTRDGFVLVVMGFTGAKALKFKMSYIRAFNDMEASIKAREVAPRGPLDLTDPDQLIPLLSNYAQRTKEAEAKVVEFQPKAEAFDRFMNSEGLYGLQNAARAIGARPNLFIRWLKSEFLFYQGNALVARVRYSQMRIFEVISTIIDDKARPRTYVTPKGLEYLRKRVPAEILIGGADA